MSNYQEQLAKCKDTTEDYSNIWRSSGWTITDYEELFEDIDRGYIIQSQEENYFIINPDWEEEEEDSDDEDEDSVAHPVYMCDGGCETIMGSDDDCKRICNDCESDMKKVEEENGYGMCDNLCGVVAKFQNKSGKNWCGGYCYDGENPGCDGCNKDATYQNNYGDNYCSYKCEDREE